MNPRISVFITSYNQKEYLVEAIESVLNQTVRPSEILIVDDCSTDGSQELIRTYESKHHGLIRAFCHDKNIGISRNKAFAQKQSTGNYLTYLDGDDRFLPDKLEMELTALQQNPDARIAYSNFYLIDECGRRLKLWADGAATLPSGYIFPQVFSRDFPGSTLFRNELISRACFDKIGYYDQERATHEDWDFKIRLSKYFRAVYCPAPLIEYRQHAKGVRSYLSSAFLFNQMIEVYHKNLPLLADAGQEERDGIKIKLAAFFAHRTDRIIRRTVESGQRRQAFGYYRQYAIWMSFRSLIRNFLAIILPIQLRKTTKKPE